MLELNLLELTFADLLVAFRGVATLKRQEITVVSQCDKSSIIIANR